MAEKYRPSNGTEGDAFMTEFCYRCERDRAHQESGGEQDGCPIIANSLAFSIDEPGYPGEWIVDVSGPKCTAFIPSGAQLPIPRCTKTQDMFGEPQ